MPEYRVELSPSVVASMNEPAPPPPAPPPQPEVEAAAQPGMSRLETYGAYEPTVLKARPRPTSEREEEITLPTRSLAGYVFVAVVAVAVAALLLLGWTRWQSHDAAPTPTSTTPAR